jgi:uncharacterized DUF497 family protein
VRRFRNTPTRWGYTGLAVFAWDPAKAAANLKEHRIDFREAATVFDGLLSTTFPDADHSTSERRFLIMGASVHGRVLVVAYTEQAETVRIISARPATRRERIFYEEDSRHPK